MYLVVVESPVKGNTIQRFLGPNYQVLSSYGHIRDLPKNELGVDVENNFKPKYIIPLKSRKIIKVLKQESQKADLTILATDNDREGESIAWHLIQVLDLNEIKNHPVIQPGAQSDDEAKSKIKNYQRIVFHEITKPAIENALKHPRDIDINLVNSQQGRRILDRIVGYKLSPFLWKKVARRLSAGRVQSVAVRLICEREKEIQKFLPQEYWEITAELQSQIHTDKTTTRPPHPPISDGPLQINTDNKSFLAKLVKKDNKVIPKLGIKNKEEADKIVKDLDRAEYKISNIERKEIKRNPLPSFITSTLQQKAWQKFHWSAKMTMRIAQQLYEKGFITYHRSDSLNISDLALEAVKNFITKNFGKNYYQFRKFKTKSKLAQEAHEAIRPTRPNFAPPACLRVAESKSGKRNLGEQAYLEDKNQEKLYELIWRRFISSQMAQATFDSIVVDIQVKNYVFRTTGQTLKFDGFLKIYPLKFSEFELPELKKNEILELIKLIPSQHFTQPPPRYTEATLIKSLEKNGIGRPSTYAPILSTIQERNYIEKDDRKCFRPTEIGTVVNDLLVNHFSKIVDIKFTAQMEENLDKVARGNEEWTSVVKNFYEPFEQNLQKKYQEVSKNDIAQKTTNKICPKCGAPLIIKLGKFGKFYACSNFPKCRYTTSLEKKTLGIKCPQCEQGEIVEKRTRKGKVFYGCSNWPECDFALWDKPLPDKQTGTGKKCPKCGSLLVETKKGVKCSNKGCDYRKTTNN
ncbi:MAG: type I DNA topoisomerase [Candidatus Nealsonbacteria bacterium CG02_land_8_20_14_3_00_34_20]|uniref:DNA topoisomerase 1 n=1 Tax=Candidatus Nealsonbacteria bacterium CG02_land_8_20_14_3_00_34_20 TaxID=1974698 RepID=A0A2M7DBI5_9BACT|nr:MAG: type I DNA topoisomerase [Candidatus Nealsonbacteria bacterium CG02_land_8_20_14_3_00_34_20]